MLASADTAQRSLFILSGEDSTIPCGELKALIETYSSHSEIRMEGHRIAIVEGDVDPIVVSKRAAYIRLGGIHIGSTEAADEEGFRRLDFTRLPRFRSFAARICNFTDASLQPDLEAVLGHAVKERFPSARVSLTEPDLLIVGAFDGERLQIGGVDASSIRRSWFDRRPRSRPFFHPAVLYPKFARLLVNLVHLREGELLLDPFCGTGSVLIEAGLIGIRSLGVDISRRMCVGAWRNLRYFDVTVAEIVNGDVRCLPVRGVDGVATDTPYGRASSTHRRTPGRIVEDLLDRLETVLPSGRYACIVHTDDADVRERVRFETVQEHRIRIHRHLTRTITLLKRI